MNASGRILIAAALAGAISVPAVLAQSSQTAQNNQSQPNQDQYTGVSHPPPDSTILANDDTEPPPPAAPRAKPSAAIPMKPAAAPATTSARAASAAQSEDPDYGIVTAQSIAAWNAQHKEAELHASTWNPDDDIVNYVPSNPNELAAATNITVRLSQDLSTTDTAAGAAFRGTVTSNVYKDGRIIIPAGSEMRGRVTAVSEGHRLGPHASLRLRPDVVILPDGTAYHLYATVVESQAPGTHSNDEGAIQANSHYTKDAVEYGAGMGVAAAAGGAVAGPAGAGVGSLVGAGLVTTHIFLQHPQEADLPRGSVLVFSLTEPMELTPTKN